MATPRKPRSHWKPCGSPPKHDYKKLVKSLEEYIENTPVPIIAEWCYLNNIPKGTAYEAPALSDLLKKATTKKEAALERGTLNGSLSVPMAIFSLKQLGWRDNKQEVSAEIKITGGLPD